LQRSQTTFVVEVEESVQHRICAWQCVQTNDFQIKWPLT